MYQKVVLALDEPWQAENMDKQNPHEVHQGEISSPAPKEKMYWYTLGLASCAEKTVGILGDNVFPTSHQCILVA